jgi:chromosome segregation ATPase
MMDIQLTDISLFAVSFTACIYCFVLSRRLKTLQDTKDGLGATIVAFSQSISDMSSSTKETNLRAKQIAQNLTTAIHAADASAIKIAALLEALDAKETHLTRNIAQATQDVDADLQGVLDEAKLYANEISSLLKEIKTLPVHARNSENTTNAHTSRTTVIEHHDLF